MSIVKSQYLIDEIHLLSIFLTIFKIMGVHFIFFYKKKQHFQVVRFFILETLERFQQVLEDRMV